ncbi:MAG TPA: hypothetical protein VFU93_01585 [Acidimicrobiales bacterium]|nr:hypothetical protein [Acidimicrobiales bacterium]
MRRILPVLVLAMGTLIITAAPSNAGGGCHGTQTEGSGTTVEMTGMCFTPTVLRVEPGTEVEFVNRDPLAHIAIGVGWGEWKELGTGDAITHRFDETGSFPYTCNLHPGMSGVVVVGDAQPIASTREAAGTTSPLVPVLAAAAVGAGAFVLGRRQRALANVPR